MLRVQGKCLEVKTEQVNGPTGTFESTEFSVLTGKSSVERVRAGRDLGATNYPREGEDVDLEVVVSAWAGKNGAGYRLTAIGRAPAVRIAPPAAGTRAAS